MKRLLLVALLATACTDESGSRRALEAQGFTDVVIDGYAWFGCSEDDHFHTSFHAKNATGHPVSGVVCCGVLKNCTVRF